jgi:UPF0755 protein
MRLRTLAVGVALAGAAGCGGPEPGAPRAQVYIPRGSPLAAVADSLEAHGVIEEAWQFRLYGRARGLSRRVRPGLYAFPVGERWATIVAALMTGRTEDISFTVPEGLTVAEVAQLAATRLRLARDSVQSAIRDSFLAAARDPLLRQEFGIASYRAVREPLEGYLLPETYLVSYDSRTRDVVRQMLRQFTQVWDSSFERRAAALGMSRHEVVTLASIVEAEARVRSEQRRIAGVYHNRLRRRMYLQADPTVIYALGEEVRRVLYRHLEIRSPYNTYKSPGLPPGPIGNPGRSAIEATLDPERHDFYFFVARPDGRHMFSRTAGEHYDSVAVARILRSQFEARRDSLDRAARDSAAAARSSRSS